MASELIEKKKWKDILVRFTDVLKLNLLVVDSQGQVLIPPVYERYGWDFFSRACLKCQSSDNYINRFQVNGEYLEYRCESGLHCFAVPIQGADGEPFAYLITGPVVLNKKEDTAFYAEASKKLGFRYEELLEVLNVVRVVSFVSMKSILDLLYEVGKDVIELKMEKKRIRELKFEQAGVSKEISAEICDTAQEMYTTIHLDELLVTMLDIALKMTNTECGSIMVIDEKTKELAIKVSRGLSKESVQAGRLRIGDGIAGLAAKENSSFVIHGDQAENRIKPLLKRNEIKHAVVMPLSTKKRVFGVLNLHTKNQDIKIDDNLNNLQYLSRLISAAFQSL